MIEKSHYQISLVQSEKGKNDHHQQRECIPGNKLGKK